MDGFLVDHQFYAVICDVDDRAFAKQVCPSARLAVYLVLSLVMLLVEGTRGAVL